VARSSKQWKGWSGGFFVGVLFASALFTALPEEEIPQKNYAGVIGLPTSHFLLERERFSVGYDGRLKQPAWVYEDLLAEEVDGKLDRKDYDFKEDEELPEVVRSTLGDYKGSGYDRGHMVPAGDCKCSAKKLEQSFLLSNISPQTAGLNRQTWRKLEGHTRRLAKEHERVEVISGPLFLPEEDEEGKKQVSYQVIGEQNVAVPTHYFKVIKWRAGAEAYILPNIEKLDDRPLKEYQVTLDKVEELAGATLP